MTNYTRNDPLGDRECEDREREQAKTVDSIHRPPELAENTGVPDLAENADHYLYGAPKASRAKGKAPYLVYVAGPYSAASRTERDGNIARADEAGRELLSRGYIPFVPHKMTANWEDDDRFGEGDFMQMDLEWLARCDAILMVAGWKDSKGARIERAWAEGHGLPIWYSIEVVPDLRKEARGDT